jgi:hypothetical protein
LQQIEPISPAGASEKLFSRNGTIRNRAIYLYGVEFFAGDPRKLDSALQAPEVPQALASVLPD